LEADRVVSEADFQERLAQAEAAKSAAVQNEAELVARLDNQRKNSEAEITEIRAAAEADAVRIRQEAVASATAQFQLQIAAKDEAVAEANTKALCAQQELRTFSEQQDHMINERLNSQREILEKDKETAVNVEKANAFEENQKLSAKVNELQRALEKKTVKNSAKARRSICSKRYAQNSRMTISRASLREHLAPISGMSLSCAARSAARSSTIRRITRHSAASMSRSFGRTN
jgi:hypothetical protein